MSNTEQLPGLAALEKVLTVSMSKGRELQAAVADSISNIRLGVTAYVFHNQRATYRTVAVELRKLLLDANAARSFGAKGKAPTVLRLAYGRLDRIFLQSLQPKRDSVNAAGWADVGPPLYPDPKDILRRASADDHLVSFRNWLKETPVRDAQGALRKTSRVLQDIADKEGAHIIDRWGGKDWRETGFAFAVIPADPREMTTEEVANLSFDANWEQFVIAAGASLLYARKREQRGSALLFDANQRPPEVDRTAGQSFTLRRRTSSAQM